MRTRRVALTILALLTVAGCSAPAPGGGSGEVPEQEMVVAPEGTPLADVEVVYDWREVGSAYFRTYFRVVRVNGQCLIEEYHYESGGTSIVLAPDACER